jgi:hypothetical protein
MTLVYSSQMGFTGHETHDGGHIHGGGNAVNS